MTREDFIPYQDFLEVIRNARARAALLGVELRVESYRTRVVAIIPKNRYADANLIKVDTEDDLIKAIHAEWERRQK